jgi:hypothetical protein
MAPARLPRFDQDEDTTTAPTKVREISDSMVQELLRDAAANETKPPPPPVDSAVVPKIPHAKLPVAPPPLWLEEDEGALEPTYLSQDALEPFAIRPPPLPTATRNAVPPPRATLPVEQQILFVPNSLPISRRHSPPAPALARRIDPFVVAAVVAGLATTAVLTAGVYLLFVL